MLIPVRELVNDFGVRPNGVLHLGAHTGEELNDYSNWNWGHVWWVEGNPAAFLSLQSRIRATRRAEQAHTPVLALIGAYDGQEVALHVASNGQSSSILDLGTHRTQHPEVTYTGEVVTGETVSVDTIVEQYGVKADFVNLDLQGYELEALRGAQRLLPTVKWVYTEVNRAELYVGCAMVTAIDAFLETFGFERVETRWTRHDWGDALYVHKNRRR